TPKPTPAPVTIRAALATPTAGAPAATPTPVPTRTPEVAPTPLVTPIPPPLTGPLGLVAFESTRDGNAEIYVVNADGIRQTNLTQHPADDRWPSWSPDGSRIAFFSMRSGRSELYVMDADGANPVQLTHTLSTNIVYQNHVVWSADGQRILAVRRMVWGRYEMHDSWALELIRVNGSG